MLSVDWTAVGSIAASVGVIATITAMIVESRRARFSHAITILMQLDERFESPEFRETRRLAAAYLKAGRPSVDALGRQSLADLFSFFENLGYLVRNSAIDSEMVWHTFGTWFLPYWKAGEGFVNEAQAHDPSRFKECSGLYDKVLVIEEREQNYRSENSIVSKPQIERFLNAEASLPRKVALGPGAG